MMGRHGKRPKPGDILELEFDGQFAYLQYLGKHPDYGDAVRVSDARPEPWSAAQRDPFESSYVTFYPVTAAAAQGLVEVVGHAVAPAVPQQLRRAGARADGAVKSWVIEDGSKDVVKTKLSTQELQLPIAAICNHELLVQRIAAQWDPRQVGASPLSDEAEALRAAGESSPVNTCHTIRHYLYLPTEQNAKTVARALEQRGFRTRYRLDAEAVDWLVLALHDVIPTLELVTSTRQAMEALVAPFSGEYDGWEVDIEAKGDTH